MVMRNGGVWYPLNQLREQLNREFSGLMHTLPETAGRLVSAGSFPAINVWDKDDELFAEVELPGMKHEDVDISVAGKELTIRGQRGERAEDGAVYHRRERGTGSYTRVVRLPVEVDSSRVVATLKDGVLSITLPRHEAAKARKIQVTPAS